MSRPDPVSVFLAIQQKVNTREPEDYPHAEMWSDFADLFIACHQILTENGNLRTEKAKAQDLADERLIQLFEKDIEIHELRASQENP